MRVGQWELQILLSSEFNKPEAEQTPLPESFIDNNVYVHGQPEQEYFVRLKIYPDSVGRFPTQYLRTSLEIDGQDVNYWKRLDLSMTPIQALKQKEPGIITFKGIQSGEDKIIPFRFPPKSNTESNLNAIHNVILRSYSCKVVPGTVSNRVNHIIKSNQSLALPLSSSSTITPDNFHPLPKWIPITDAPTQTLCFYFSSTDTIKNLQTESNLRKEKELIRHHQHNKLPIIPERRLISSDDEGESIRKKPRPALRDANEEDFEVSIIEHKKEVPCLDLTLDEDEQSWKNELL